MKKLAAVFGVVAALGSQAFALPTIDGVINVVTEGWTLLREDPDAQPATGGQTGSSDLVNESSASVYYSNPSFSTNQFQDNRADTINLYYASDANNLYIAAAGPTAPFNSFTDAGGNGDQGDMYIAIDASLSAAGGNLAASGGHTNFGVKAVDFMGWTPTHIVGVLYVDNGGGGGGYANIEETGSGNVMTGDLQGQNNGGFDWMGKINSSASYDTFNGNAGEFEFVIPWSMLGLSGQPNPTDPLRIMFYTTQNPAGYDGYDSAPGVGQGVSQEQIGDSPGDDDAGGQWGASDGGITHGEPGSNFIADFSQSPSHTDGVDTIEEYFVFAVPEPGTWTLLGIGALALAARRMRK